jgi:hypothetical protein
MASATSDAAAVAPHSALPPHHQEEPWQRRAFIGDVTCLASCSLRAPGHGASTSLVLSGAGTQ